MSLITYPECEEPVSDSAKIYPHCGYKMKDGCFVKALKMLFYCSLIICIILVTLYFYSL